MKCERCNLKKIIKISEKFVKITLLSVVFNTETGFYYDKGILSEKLDDITVELGESVPDEKIKTMTSLLEKSDLSLEDSIPVDEDGNTSKIGVYHYYFVYVDTERKFSKVVNQSKVLVIDTVKPEIVLNSGDYTVKYGSEISVNEVAKCVDLSNCSMCFEEEIDTTVSGSHIVNIKAIDEGKNESERSITINVEEKPIYRPVINNYYNYGSIGNMNNHNNEVNNSLENKELERNEIITFAMQFVGNPYVYGGNSLTNGTDCSGFTQAIYANYNYWLPRSSTDQAYIGYSVDRSELLPGDIIVYYNESGLAYHVGMFLGGNTMIHAGTPQTGIKIQEMFEGYRGYRRIIV